MRPIVFFAPSSRPGPWWKNTTTGNGPSPSGRTTCTPIGPLRVVISSVRVCIPPLLCLADAAATIGGARRDRLAAEQRGYRAVMTDEEHLENTVQEVGGDQQSFDVYLPVSPAVDERGATHVARMRGNEAAFVDVLAGFVATGSDLSEPLRSPI